MICNNVHGKLPHLLLAYLLSIHIGKRSIYLSRPGHVDVLKIPENNETNEQQPQHQHDTSLSLETTSTCTLNGSDKAFAEDLKTWITEDVSKNTELQVYSSTLPRALETAHVIT